MTIDLKAINGIIYNKEKIDNMDEVIAPPYDVISDEYREQLMNRCEYNFVKIILPDGEKDVKKADNCYVRASETIKDWMNKGVLVQLEKPAIFYIVQEYMLNDKLVQRKGFIAQNKIEDFSKGNILPHEFTMSGPKEDRLNLVKACQANLSQVFFVYSDKEKQIEKKVDLTKEPYINTVDDNGVRTKVWLISDEETISVIQKVVSDKKLLIADGHHRYETAMNYRNFIREQNGSDDAGLAEYVMAYFTNMEDDLLIYPTHRVLTKTLDKETVLNSVKKYFDVEQPSVSSKEEFVAMLEATSGLAIGLYFKDEYYLCKLTSDVSAILDEYEVPDVLKDLDLVVLHKILLTKELGYSETEQMSQNGVLYIKQEEVAFDMVDNKEATCSFILKTPSIRKIMEVSQAGFRMPQKSTYFYPKLLSGIVINPLS